MSLQSSSAGTPTPRESSPSPPPALPIALPASHLPTASTSSSAASSPSSTTAPTWPHPSAVSLSTFRVLNSASSSRSRRALYSGVPTPRATRFELALVDRLADCLEADLESIWEASGAHMVEIRGRKGERRLLATGSASAITKARQLVDARLSQTPIRVLLAVRLSHPVDSAIELVAVPTSTLRLPPQAPQTLYRAHECPVAEAVGVSPNSLATALAPHASLSPSASLSPALSDVNTPGATTDSSESSSGFFTAQSRSQSRHSLLGDTASSLPSIGSYTVAKDAYVDAVVDELDQCVQRRSLVRLKLAGGVQYFTPDEGSGTLAFGEGQRWSMDEVEKWKIDGPSKTLGHHFSVALSSARADELCRVLVDQFGLELSHETSHVHVKHLDRRRAVYAVATSELRGSEIKGLSEGVSTNGTLNLKKVSTLPSKPFFLSITSPIQEGEPMREGTDLRIKVLSDKAATSPSLELSQSFNRASWDLDASGRFEVHLTLDPERFSQSQTEIRYVAKSRCENEKFRATLCEIRLHGSHSHWYEIEFASKVLNAKLATTAQHAQSLERDGAVRMVEELVEFCEEVLMSAGGGGETPVEVEKGVRGGETPVRDREARLPA